MENGDLTIKVSVPVDWIETDESVCAMVLLVNPIDEPGVRQLIVETFLVS